MFPNPNYHAKVGPGVQWALRHLPFYGRWYRFLIVLAGAATAGSKAARVDPDWPDQERCDQRRQRHHPRRSSPQWIASQVGDDPELLAKVIPDYPADGQAHAAGQRQLAPRAQARQRRAGPRRHRPHRRGRHRHRRRGALRRRHHRVRDGLPGQPVPVADGDHRPRRHRPVRGLGRRARRPTSGSPCPTSRTCSACTGPGTNLAHGGSLIFHSECQMRYITGCIETLVDGGHAVDGAAPGRARRVLRADPATSSRASCGRSPSIEHSWFKNPRGTDPRAEPVAAGRLLGVDPRARPRRLRHSLISRETPSAVIVSSSTTCFTVNTSPNSASSARRRSSARYASNAARFGNHNRCTSNGSAAS